MSLNLEHHFGKLFDPDRGSLGEELALGYHPATYRFEKLNLFCRNCQAVVDQTDPLMVPYHQAEEAKMVDNPLIKWQAINHSWPEPPHQIDVRLPNGRAIGTITQPTSPLQLPRNQK